MKRLLIISIMLLFPFFISMSQNLIYNSINFKYTDFVRQCCLEMEISGQKIYITYADMDVVAYIDKTFAYIIYINSSTKEDVRDILAHEIVHIKQDIDGRWDIKVPTTKITSFGERYTSTSAKNIEHEAIRVGKKMCKKVKRFLKKEYGITR